MLFQHLSTRREKAKEGAICLPPLRRLLRNDLGITKNKEEYSNFVINRMAFTNTIYDLTVYKRLMTEWQHCKCLVSVPTFRSSETFANHASGFSCHWIRKCWKPERARTRASALLCVCDHFGSVRLIRASSKNAGPVSNIQETKPWIFFPLTLLSAASCPGKLDNQFSIDWLWELMAGRYLEVSLSPPVSENLDLLCSYRLYLSICNSNITKHLCCCSNPELNCPWKSLHSGNWRATTLYRQQNASY